MNKNPKIKVKPSQFTKTLEFVNYILIILFWFFAGFAYNFLPEEIPTHYNGLGEVDAYGDKITILFLPLLASILFVILTITAKKPHFFNYSVTITAENVEVQYKNAMRLMHLINLFVLAIFIFIDYKTILIALNKSDSLGIWFLPLTGIVGISIIIYSVKQSKKENI